MWLTALVMNIGFWNMFSVQNAGQDELTVTTGALGGSSRYFWPTTMITESYFRSLLV